MGPFAEFDNIASNTKYPFADGCSMLDASGAELPAAFLLDISFCLRSRGLPYLASLSKGVGTIAVDGEPVASFSYTGPDTVQVVSSDTGKPIGLAVLGSAASGMEEYEFDEGEMAFCPACFCTMFSSSPIVSVSPDFDSPRLYGNVRITGKNGVYVTKIGVNKLRIDIIGEASSSNGCCDNPIRGLVVLGRCCPAIAGTVMQYSAVSGDGITIPGVVAMHSILDSDAVCGRQESYIQPDGSLGRDYCKSPKETEKETPCMPSYGPFTVYPSNGNIDLVPYSSPGEGANPISVKTVKAGAGALPAASGLSEASVENLASLAGSGTVVVGLKGSSD